MFVCELLESCLAENHILVVAEKMSWCLGDTAGSALWSTGTLSLHREHLVLHKSQQQHEERMTALETLVPLSPAQALPKQ